MNTVEDVINVTDASATAKSKPRSSHWCTAAERADGIRAKKNQKRKKHRAALKRSNSKG